jgi:DNA helicase-2/ATP-dependent DNA helicase PcrA
MSNPSPEQQRIIDDASRIRIVRAAPGSGKTWLVGQIIKKELETWNKPGGIAALSFTRVGGEEIRNAVGYELSLPHFVGTLDSFLFRYIVKPFLSKCYKCKVPRLIPASYGSEFWKSDTVKHQIKERFGKFTTYNLLDIDFGKCENGDIKLLYSFYGKEKKEVPQQHRTDIIKKKESIWQNLGWVSHSDVHFLAHKILESRYGHNIILELEKRFPFIIVDELQDTGYYICEFLKKLLFESNIKSILVGDPNQSIYEFNGATPDMFNTFKDLAGSTEITLFESRRCPQKIINIAQQIIPDNSQIKTTNPELGKAVLLCYNKDFFAKEVNRIINKIQNENSQHKKIKAIARNTSTLNELRRHCGETEIKSIGSQILTHITRGVQQFLLKQNSKALRQISDALSLLLFDKEGFCDDDLKDRNIDPFLWKNLVCEILLASGKTKTNLVTYKNWQEIVKQEVIQILKQKTFLEQYINDNLLSSMKVQNRKGSSDQVSLFLQIPQENSDVPLLTVHGVKGETHDVTIFICPPKKRGVPCPSDLWWNGEERRIMYVAFTRSREILYLVVSKETAQNLKINHKSFYDCFEVMNIEDFAPEPNWKDLI